VRGYRAHWYPYRDQQLFSAETAFETMKRRKSVNLQRFQIVGCGGLRSDLMMVRERSFRSMLAKGFCGVCSFPCRRRRILQKRDGKRFAIKLILQQKSNSNVALDR
jgi:hypothetical protein